mgnify:CR=1 FL=1
MGEFDDLMAKYNQEKQANKAKSMTGATKGLITTANAATLGLGGQAYGLAGGVGEYLEGGDFSKGYTENRDLIHAIEKSYKDEYPNIAMGTGIAASLPLTMFNPLPMKAMGTAANALTTGQKTARVLGNVGRAGVTAAGYGAISGLGNSDANNIGGILQDAQNSALYSGVAGGLSYGALAGAGGVGRNIYQRTPMGKASAGRFADLKVAEALARDAEGKLFNANPNVNPPSDIIDQAGNMAAARMGKLPQGTPLANASGGNLLDLTDIAAISGGATKQAVLGKQHQLAAQEARRMTDSAAKALGTGRPDYNTTIEAFSNAAKLKAAPYYNQLQGVNLQIDDDLRGILARSEPFFAGSNLRSKVDNVGGATLKEALNPAATSVPLARLDVLKQTLYDMEEAGKRSGKLGLSRSIAKLRNELTNKLDDLSPKTQQGDSVYKLARDAYGGDMQLKNAVEQGRLIFREDAMNIRDTLKTMSQSEKDAFRLGVYQAIVDKTGKMSGRTELMNNYRDPAITDRLKAVFGSDYRKFASKLAAEFELKKFQKVAGGSQTATRQQGLNDIELSPLRDASEGVGALASSNARGAINPLTRLWQGMAVPESVRTQIGKTLLLEGQQAQDKLKTLNDIVKQVNQQKQQNAIRYGSTFGQLYGGQQ